MMKSNFYDKSLAGIYEAVGGIEAFRRISKRFHHKVEQDPALRHLFPKNMAPLEERVALYLAERTGGAPDYTAARGKNSLFCRHAHLAIGTGEAASWLAHMTTTLAEEHISEEAATLLITNLTALASTLADPFIALYHLPLPALREKLTVDPSLVHANDRGRNLICATAIALDVPRLRLLLECGADVETKDAGGHNALYRISNSMGPDAEARSALELLLAYGANVNQTTGVGGMTPLHMAARRGATGIAELLLNAGAEIEARDKNGETPLRRAVNCGKEPMVELLMNRGADPKSADKLGRTPIDAARTNQLRSRLVARR